MVRVILEGSQCLHVGVPELLLGLTIFALARRHDPIGHVLESLGLLVDGLHQGVEARLVQVQMVRKPELSHLGQYVDKLAYRSLAELAVGND